MPFKLSLVNLDNGETLENVDLDDSLVERLRGAVDADPDLTIAKALHQGVEHVADNGPMRRGLTEH